MNWQLAPTGLQRYFFVAAWLIAPSLLLTRLSQAENLPDPPRFFGILAVDEQTGRGIPLVELETVNHVRLVTDSNGWAAFAEPGLMGQPVYFHVRSHGYEFPADGLGYAGVVLTPVTGKHADIRLKRKNVAERLYRLTGQGIYRDSVLLGKPVPLEQPLGAGKVAGQDSAFAAAYRDRIYWFWGDTSRMRYPLGQFWTAGATSLSPDQGGLDPAEGVNFEYFVGEDGFSRPMARLDVRKGLVWVDAVTTLKDDAGADRLVCHYAHMQSLANMLGHGLAIYDDQTDRFEQLNTLDMDQRWRFPGQAHPVHHRDGDTEYLYLGEVFPTVRVPATLSDFRNSERYESWTCLEPGSSVAHPRFVRDENGRRQYGWRHSTEPIDIAAEWRWLADGTIQPEDACFVPLDIDSGKPIRLHRGSVAWNPHRQRWVMIATEQGGTSFLGEVWYAEAAELTGPWRKAKKVVSHDQYSFYNPVHHTFLDQHNGRWIFFEGTYTTTFSKNSTPTPRYDYNQIMYRLDLDDARLEPVRN